jgi:hypothetical protein
MWFLSTLLVAAAVIASAAVDNHVIGPFALRITGKVDSGIDGSYPFYLHPQATYLTDFPSSICPYHPQKRLCTYKPPT